MKTGFAVLIHVAVGKETTKRTRTLNYRVAYQPNKQNQSRKAHTTYSHRRLGMKEIMWADDQTVSSSHSQFILNMMTFHLQKA